MIKLRNKHFITVAALKKSIFKHSSMRFRFGLIKNKPVKISKVKPLLKCSKKPWFKYVLEQKHKMRRYKKMLSAGYIMAISNPVLCDRDFYAD